MGARPATQEEAAALTSQQATPTAPAGIQFDEKALDSVTGAPAGVRQAVGAAKTPGDRLATIRKFFPDAQPYDGDNFVFFNPSTKMWTLYNPPGLIPDVGDLASIGRETAEMVGGGLGAATGLALSSPSAVVSGPVGPAIGTAIGAGTGAGMAAQAYDAVAPMLFGTVDTRNTGEKAVQAGVDFFGNAIGQRVGEMAGQGINRLFRGAVSSMAGPQAPQIAGEFAQAGIPLRLPSVLGGRGIQGMEQGVRNMATGGDVIQRAIDETTQQIETRLGDLSGLYRGGGVPARAATDADAGLALRRGGREFLTAFDQESDRLYTAFGNRLPNGDATLVELTNTTGALNQVVNRFATAPELGRELQPALFRRYADAIGKAKVPGNLTWGELSAFRTKIGQMIADPVARADTDRAALNGLYAALSRDMEAAATAAGPDALAVFRAANRHYRNGLSVIDGALADIVDPKATRESVWFNVRRLALQGTSRESARDLAVIRRSVSPEAWDVYASAALRELGVATNSAQNAAGDVFSVNTFLTNWNRLSPESRAILFRGTRYGDLPDQLDRLTRLVSRLKDAGRLANTSNTAVSVDTAQTLRLLGYNAGAATLGAMTGDVAGAAGAVAATTGAMLAPRVAARLMTNPRFVEWLANSPMRTLTQARGNVGNPMAGHIGRLANIAVAEPAISEEIYQFLSAIGASSGSAPVAQTATTQ